MPAPEATLYLHEELLLIVLRDEEGTVDRRAGFYQYALAAGVLSELLLAGRITVTPDKKQYVEVADQRPLGDELLDECLSRMATAKRRERLQNWVTRIGNQSGLRHRVAQNLCRKGVLRADEDRVLWIFRRRIYPERDPRFERHLVERLRRAIFNDAPRVEARTLLLVALAHGTNLLHLVFPRRELRARQARLKRIVAGDLAGRAAQAAVQAAQAACVAAITVTTMAATAATS